MDGKSTKVWKMENSFLETAPVLGFGLFLFQSLVPVLVQAVETGTPGSPSGR